MFHTITYARTLDSRPLTWKELLPLWSFWSAVAHSESTGALKLCVDNMCAVAAGRLSEALDVLSAAIGDLRKARGDDALSEAALLSLFSNHSRHVKTLPELSKLLSLSNAALSSEVSKAALELYKDVVSRLACDCPRFDDLERLHRQVMEDARLEFAAMEFSSIAAKRVVDFPPMSIISWLKSDSYGALKVPSAKQLISKAVRCDLRGSFEEYVRLFEYIETNLDVSGVNLPEAFRKLVEQYCTRDASGAAFCDVVALLPTLSLHVDSTLEVLSRALGHVVKPNSKACNYTEFMSKFCSSLPGRGKDLTPPISKLMDDVIAALLKHVELNEQSERLKVTFERVPNTPLYRIFRARFVLLYFERTKLLSAFQSVADLRRRLQEIGKVQDGRMLKTMLEVLNLIEYDSKLYGQEVEAAEPVGKILTPLRTYCLNLFGEESIGATSKADLDELIRYGPSTLEPIEQTLKQREPWQILSRLNRHRDTWQLAYEELKCEVTFLGWLTKDDSCGIPKLVEELAATSHFRALGDAEHESSTVMAARSRAANEWLTHLGTASRPSTERRFFQHFVIDAPQAAASRSVLFGTLSALSAKRSQAKTSPM